MQKHRRLLNRLLALVLCFTLCAMAAARAETYACGQAAEKLAAMADDYAGLRAEAILGQWKANAPLTAEAACDMVLRAFGDLPAPEGMQRWLGEQGLMLTGATPAMLALHEAGLLTRELAAPALPVDEALLETLVRRVYGYLAVAPEDDFYAFYNNPVIRRDESVQDQVDYDLYGYTNSAQKSFDAVGEWYTRKLEKIQRNGPANEQERHVLEAYELYHDVEARNALGMAPLSPYLRELDAVKSIADLTALWARMTDELGTEFLLTFYQYTSPSDREKPLLYVEANLPCLDDESYFDEESYAYRAKVEQDQGKLTAMGYPADAEQMEGYMAFLQTYTRIAQNADFEAREMTLAQAQEHIPALGLGALLAVYGFDKKNPDCYVRPATLETVDGLLRQENLAHLKIFTCLRLCEDYGGYLSLKMMDKSMGIWGDYFAADPSLLDADYLSLEYMIEMVPNDISAVFLSDYRPASVIAELPELFDRLRGALRTRLTASGVLGKAALEETLKKLDNYALWYDASLWDYDFHQGEFLSATEGGTLFEARRRTLVKQRKAHAASNEILTADMRDNAGLFSGMAANYYRELVIVTTPTYLMEPWVPENCTREQLFAGVGFMLAHELTHSVDPTCRFIDARGNQSESLWSEDDIARYDRICEKINAYYDGREIAPGITQDPTQTLSENFADLSAMEILIDCLPTDDDFDLNAFFMALAQREYLVGTNDGLWLLSKMDEHSNGAVRINAMLSACGLFHDTFDIKEGDGMYVPPEERPSVWRAVER